MGFMRRPSRHDYDRKAKREEAKAWLFDKTLYELCCKYPEQVNRAHINAKIWIIARAMATGIERQIKSDMTPGSALDKLARCIQDNPMKVKRIFKELRGITGNLNDDNAKKIVSCHGRFMKLIS